jgi:hypothetical protein
MRTFGTFVIGRDLTKGIDTGIIRMIFFNINKQYWEAKEKHFPMT